MCGGAIGEVREIIKGVWVRRIQEREREGGVVHPNQPSWGRR